MIRNATLSTGLILFFVFQSLCLTPALGQTLYHFPQPGFVQGEIYNGDWTNPGQHNASVTFMGDTMIGGVTYSHMENEHFSDGYVRYDSGRIYSQGRNFDGSLSGGSETLLYDFTLQVGDTFSSYRFGNIIVDSVSTITMLNGQNRKYMELSNGFDTCKWIDAIGDIERGLYYGSDFEGGHEELVCHQDYSGTVFVNSLLNLDCDSLKSTNVNVLQFNCSITETPVLPADTAGCLNGGIAIGIPPALNDSVIWHWYSGSCGGMLEAIGDTVLLNPHDTTIYYVRGEIPGCSSYGSCNSFIVNTIGAVISACDGCGPLDYEIACGDVCLDSLKGAFYNQGDFPGSTIEWCYATSTSSTSDTLGFSNRFDLKSGFCPDESVVPEHPVLIQPVTLILKVDVGICGVVMDSASLTIVSEPLVDAGPDQLIHTDSLTGTVQLDATVDYGVTSELSSPTWHATGSGLFLNNSPNTIYVLGPGDTLCSMEFSFCVYRLALFAQCPVVCDTVQIGFVDSNQTLPLANFYPDAVVNNGDSVQFLATGAETFIWDNGMVNGTSIIMNGPISNDSIVERTVIGFSPTMCPAIDSIQITIRNFPKPLLGPVDSSTLFLVVGDSLNWDFTSDSLSCPTCNMTWSDGSMNFSNSYHGLNVGDTTDIWVTISDSGDSYTSYATIIVVAPLVADAGAVILGCAGSNQSIGGAPTATGGSGNYVYSWSPMTFLSDFTAANPVFSIPAISADSSITFYVTVMDSSTGLTNMDSLVLPLFYVPVVDLGPDTVLCKDECWEYDLSWLPTVCPTCPCPNWSSTGFIPQCVFSLCENDAVLPGCFGTPCTIPTIVYISNGVCLYTDTIHITFASDIVASIDTLPLQCYEDIATINGTGSGGLGGPFTYEWTNLGDTSVNVLNVRNTSVQMLESTCYELVVADSNASHCADTTTQCFSVTDPIIFTHDTSATVCKGDSFDLNATFLSPFDPVAAGLSFGWFSFTGGVEDPTLDSTSGFPGIGDTTTAFVFQVLSPSGCSVLSSEPLLVEIIESPVANFIVDTVCGGDVMTFRDISSGDSVIIRNTNFGDGTAFSTWSTTKNDHVYENLTGNDTTYFVNHVVISSNGCSDDTTISVFVRGKPEVIAGIDQTVCPNLSVSIGGSPTGSGTTGPFTYNWYQDLGNGVYSINEIGADTNASNPLVTPVQDGQLHSYVVEVSDFYGCVNLDTVTLQIINLLAQAGGTDFGGINDTIRICKGDDAELGAYPSAVSGGNPPYLFQWTTGATGGVFSTSNMVEHPLVQSSIDIDQYMLRVEDNAGCFDFDTVTVKKLDYPAISPLSDQQICIGENTVLGSGVTPEVGVIYVWSPNMFDDGSDTLDFMDLNWVVNGVTDVSYVLSAINAANCITNDTVQLQVQPLPTVFAGNDTSICFGDYYHLYATADSNVNMIWDGGYQNGDSVMIIDSGQGNEIFVLSGTDAFGCVGSDSIVVSPAICDFDGIEEFENTMAIYPNPSTGKIHIQLDNVTENISIHILNEVGQRVKTLELNKNNKALDIELSPGMYFAHYFIGESALITKIVIFD